VGEQSDAARETRNRGLKEEDHRQHQPDDNRTPRRAADQASPEPERVTTPQEDADQDISQLENPPQAEGPRERNNNAV
jgi:hypothetical protein